MELFILGRSWKTILPAPKFKWPVSELPSSPLGKPTASPEANNWVWG